jgi:hypothetical protein
MLATMPQKDGPGTELQKTVFLPYSLFFVSCLVLAVLSACATRHFKLINTQNRACAHSAHRSFAVSSGDKNDNTEKNPIWGNIRESGTAFSLSHSSIMQF